MQKKINLFCMLLLIALALGVVSYCTTNEAVESFKEGQESALSENESETKTKTPYQKGYEAGIAAAEKTPFYQGHVKLVPESYGEYSERIMNSVTKEEISMSYRDIKVLIPDAENKLEWITWVLVAILMLAIIFFVWLLLSFVADIKAGDIFVKGNEWKLNCMAAVSIYWFVAAWVTDLIYYSFIKNAVQFDGYKVVFDRPSVAPLIIGITFLLFSAIFSYGRKLKEDQEFMV